MLAAVGALALAGLVPQFLSRTLPDIAFLLYAAGRVLDGARMYVDVIEINPPLIVWLGMPIVAVARTLGASEITVYRLVVVALLAGSVLACRWVLLRTEDGRDPAFRRFLLLMMVAALFVLPRLDWGEREHLTLALVLPYILLTVSRLQGNTVGRGAVLAIGLAAAVGIAIKPHFVLLWLAREGALAIRGRRLRPSPEGWVIVGCGVAYAGAVALLAPEYFELARELGGAYQVYVHNPLMVTALLGDGAALSLGALLVAVGLWGRVASPPLRVALVVSILAFYVAAVLQLKGWRYHFYPSLALAWVLAGVVAVRVRRPLLRWTERMFAAVAGAGAATVGAMAVAGCIAQSAHPLDPRYDADPSIGRLIPVVRAHAEGRDLVVLSPNMASGFPLTTYAGARWPQRLSNLWPLVAAYDSAIQAAAPFRFRPAGEMTVLEQRVLATVAEDLRSSDAPLLLVLRTGPDEPTWGMRRLDLLDFLSRDLRLRELFDGYRRAGSIGQYDVYQRLEEPLPLVLGAPEEAAANAPAQLRVRPGSLAAGAVFLLVLGACFRRESVNLPEEALHAA